MKKLTYQTLKDMGYDGYILPQNDAPERFLQFGEGNFLRAFVDYFIDVANERTDTKSKVVVVQPIAQGLIPLLNEQEGLYSLCLQGRQGGKKTTETRLISSIRRGIDPYADYFEFLACAKNKDLRYIVSNTTEAGIVFDDTCKLSDTPPTSFPAKLTQLLYARYQEFSDIKGAGFVLLPCELIADNGKLLKDCVMKYIAFWALPQSFATWVEEENFFCPTLVDRIVTGYPGHDVAEQNNEQNGYEDRLQNTGELFGLWVIEGTDALREEFPLTKGGGCGLPVQVVPDHTPYKKRKVRILNGAHTSMVPAAFLAGQNIVRDCMEDSVIRGFMETAIQQEITPTIDLPAEELCAFADSVVERFQNPFIDHLLLSITLNCTSKWQARVLPTVKDYLQLNGTLPTCLLFSFAAYLLFFRGVRLEDDRLIGVRGDEEYAIQDDRTVLEFFYANRADSPQELCDKLVCQESFWGEDLSLIPGFVDAVKAHLAAIETNGIVAGMRQCQ